MPDRRCCTFGWLAQRQGAQPKQRLPLALDVDFFGVDEPSVQRHLIAHDNAHRLITQVALLVLAASGIGRIVADDIGIKRGIVIVIARVIAFYRHPPGALPIDPGIERKALKGIGEQ